MNILTFLKDLLGIPAPWLPRHDTARDPWYTDADKRKRLMLQCLWDYQKHYAMEARALRVAMSREHLAIRLMLAVRVRLWVLHYPELLANVPAFWRKELNLQFAQAELSPVFPTNEYGPLRVTSAEADRCLRSMLQTFNRTLDQLEVAELLRAVQDMAAYDFGIDPEDLGRFTRLVEPTPPIRTVEAYLASGARWREATRTLSTADDQDVRRIALAVVECEEAAWAECHTYFEFDQEGMPVLKSKSMSQA